MDVGDFFGRIIGVYFFVLGAFAAMAAAQALEDDDAEGLPSRVFKSLTKTTFFLGFPGLIGVLLFLNSQTTGSGNSGIMSKNMGFFVLFLFGALGLVGLWVGAIVMGFIGSAIAKSLRPMVGALVVFAFISGAPVFTALVSVVTAHQRPHR